MFSREIVHNVLVVKESDDSVVEPVPGVHPGGVGGGVTDTSIGSFVELADVDEHRHYRDVYTLMTSSTGP